MDKTKIETIATTTVKNLFLMGSEQINPSIESEDKGISFDGNIIFFNKSEFTKEGYLSSVPVQVKGTVVEKFSKESAKFYDFDFDTFKNFQLEDGVVVFLVEIIDEKPRQTKIFYKFLNTRELEDILLMLDENNHNTRVIELSEITQNSNLDTIFRNIVIERKSSGYALVKLESSLNKETLNRSGIATFDEEVVDRVSKTIEMFEYRNQNSEYNKALKKELLFVLANPFIVNTLKLASVVKKLSQLKELQILPPENRNLAILVKAKYEVIQLKFNEAKSIISEYEKTDDIYLKHFQQVFLETNLDMESFEEFKEIVSASNFLDKEEKIKNIIIYLIHHNLRGKLEAYFSEKNIVDNEWKYLYGKYLVLSGQYLKGAEQFRVINNEFPLLELQYNELQAHTMDIINRKIAGEDSNEINKFLKRVQNLQSIISTYDNLKMPSLDNLELELRILSNPVKEISTLEEMLSKGNTDIEKQQLIEYKIKSFIFSGKFNECIEFINGLEKKYLNNQVVVLKLITLERSKKFSVLYNYSLSILDSFDEILPSFSWILLERIIHSAANIKSLSVSKFEEDMDKVFLKLDPLHIHLLQLETVRKKLMSSKSGESFSKIEKLVDKSLDAEEIEAIFFFVSEIGDVEFGRRIYNILRKKHKYKADEFFSSFLLSNNNYDEILDILEEYENIELSPTMISAKSGAFFCQEQYRAILSMDKEIDNGPSDFMDKVLLAKVNLSDKDGTQSLVENLLNTDDEFYHLNAAYALIHFGIDISKGIHIFVKYVLKKNFRDSMVNQNFLNIYFSNIKKMEAYKEHDKNTGSELNWFKIKSVNNEKEVLVIPRDWQVVKNSGIEIEFIDSDFQVLTRGATPGENFKYNGEEYELVERKPLSLFVFHRILSMESGGLNSDKPFKKITIENGLDDFIKYLELTDRTQYFQEIQSNYHKFHAPFLYGKSIGKQEMIEFLDSLYEDKTERYYVGYEHKSSKESIFQISISSLVFLWNLKLLNILSSFENIFIEDSQRKFLESLIDKEIEDKTVGKLHVHEGRLVINEKDDNKKNRLRSMYKEIAIHSRKLNKNEIGVIENNIRDLVEFDDVSIQAAKENNNILLIEDESLQVIGKESFRINATSIGILISQYFLYETEDILRYLDILIETMNKNSAWILSETTLKRMIQLVFESRDKIVIEKFMDWKQQYIEYKL